MPGARDEAADPPLSHFETVIVAHPVPWFLVGSRGLMRQMRLSIIVNGGVPGRAEFDTIVPLKIVVMLHWSNE